MADSWFGDSTPQTDGGIRQQGGVTFHHTPLVSFQDAVHPW